MTWILFWQICFVVVIAIFAVMAVLVTVLGAKDVVKLLKGLKEGDEG